LTASDHKQPKISEVRAWQEAVSLEEQALLVQVVKPVEASAKK
jgi:hypothetical protein